MTKKANRLGSEWTPADERKLRSLAAARMSARLAAAELGRSRGSVAFKAMKLRVSFKAVRQPRGAQRKANRTKSRASA
jgi:hypothetical protein